MAVIIMEQSELFLISMIYGVILGVWYDFFRAIRKKITHRSRTVHLEDIVYCLSSAAGLFLLFQIYNRGSIRFYVLVGLFIGNLLYFFLLSSLVEKVMGSFLGILLMLLKTIAGIIIRPAKIIVNSSLKTLKKAMRTVKIVKSRK